MRSGIAKEPIEWLAIDGLLIGTACLFAAFRTSFGMPELAWKSLACVGRGCHARGRADQRRRLSLMRIVLSCMPDSISTPSVSNFSCAPYSLSFSLARFIRSLSVPFRRAIDGRSPRAKSPLSRSHFTCLFPFLLSDSCYFIRNGRSDT